MSRPRPKPARSLAYRSRVVWLSLVGAMTGVGGLLVALEGQRTPRMDGIALVATPPAQGPSSIGVVFNTRTPLQPGRWQGVVIHDSGALSGSASTIASEHEARGLHGLGYHFVIGNGRGGADDGELHVAYRWLDQLPGAHTAGPDQDRYNRGSIGICLVGDGDRRPFTEAQLNRLVELVAALQRECGFAAESVVLHRDVAPVASPGRLFPAAAFERGLSGSISEQAGPRTRG